MKATIEIKSFNSEVSLLLTDSTSEIVSKVLQNDKYNNKLIIGYEFELNNLKFKITNIIVEGFADEVVNGMQILITVYVEEIK